MHSVLNNVTVVLLQPERSLNIGAAARAMKNAGITRLALVRPVPKKLDAAYRAATHATDVLDGARICDSLREAVEDAAMAFALTRRGEPGRKGVMPARAMAELAAQVARDHRVALVFGPEHRGLSNDEIGQCHRTVTIPSSPECPSLNLSHAVMVACHEIFVRAAAESSGRTADREALPDGAGTEAFLAHAQRTLLAIGFLKAQNPHRLQPMLRSLLSRAEVTDRELRVLRGILSQVDWATGRAEDAPEAPCDS